MDCIECFVETQTAGNINKESSHYSTLHFYRLVAQWRKTSGIRHVRNPSVSDSLPPSFFLLHSTLAALYFSLPSTSVIAAGPLAEIIGTSGDRLE